ncbi:MAG: hypothetical protein KKD63_06660 [Proteobacteria bacterium]|nr:hypothetical protein [Desulfobulbaceae bacterium]MBU4152543.1 hypothetical protein [Pseudomonadota bacterium]
MTNSIKPFHSGSLLIVGKVSIVVFFGVLIAIAAFTSTCLAADNYFLLKEANLALDEGKPLVAAELFVKYIDSHPATNGTETPLYRKKRQYYIKNLLTAYSNLFDIYRDTGNKNEFLSRLNRLKATYNNGTFSPKNIYNLAEIYLDHSQIDAAKPLLELIIKQHIANHYPDNIKVALRASSKLIPIYRSKGENVAIESLLASLHENYPDPNFDLNDKYKLATLYLDNGKETQGTRMLQEIAEEEPFDANTPFTYTLTGTYTKLLNIFHRTHNHAAKDKLLEQLKSVSLEKLAPGNAYKLAVALLNSGKKEQGRKIFDLLANKHPQTVWARKSLFLRAQDAMSEKDWDTAINRFSTYIDRYPEQTFFAAKAYSNLLDAHWSRDGNLEDQQIKINQFADIINGMADYETQLNLARDLHRKGFNELATATFTLGYTAATKIIEKNPQSIDAMRANWLITNYGVELGKHDIARKNGASVINQSQAIKASALHSLKTKERADHFLSRTYLRLAEMNETNGEYAKAEAMLTLFIEEFPGDIDTDYARFTLGCLYEKDNKPTQAVEMFKGLTGSRWKEKARQTRN